jgi:hypothetical protein
VSRGPWPTFEATIEKCSEFCGLELNLANSLQVADLKGWAKVIITATKEMWGADHSTALAFGVLASDSCSVVRGDYSESKLSAELAEHLGIADISTLVKQGVANQETRPFPKFRVPLVGRVDQSKARKSGGWKVLGIDRAKECWSH